MREATARTGKSAQIRALAGARAFPPLMLVLYHFSEGHGYRGLHSLDLVITRGYLWVEFFFALSGFVLALSYGERALGGWRGHGRFLRARLIRLYPLHLFMLLSILVMIVVLRVLAARGGYVSIYDQPYHPFIDWGGFVANLFLVQAWHLFRYLSWNGVAWFVSVEFALCLLFPVYLRLAGTQICRGLGLIAAGIGGLVLLLAHSKHGLDITFDYGVLRGMADFAIGVGMASVYRALKARGDALSVHFHSAIQIALLAALFYALLHTGWSHTKKDIWSALPIMALVLALAFDRGILAWALGTKVPLMLGVWSYAVYMGQTTWLQLIRVFEQRLYPAPDSILFGMRFADFMWWIEPALLVLVCVLWGALLATLIEHPAANALKRFFDARAEPKPVALTPPPP